jgi:hypothetical protein
VHIELQHKFDQLVEQSIGPAAVATDFPEEDLTPDYDHMEGTADDIDHDQGNLKITPEVGDNYVGAKIMLPRRGVMQKGRVTQRMRYPDGHPNGRANVNPVLDSQSYIVEFDDNDQTKLTANLIAESMYAQCDLEGN